MCAGVQDLLEAKRQGWCFDDNRIAKRPMSGPTINPWVLLQLHLVRWGMSAQ